MIPRITTQAWSLYVLNHSNFLKKNRIFTEDVIGDDDWWANIQIVQGRHLKQRH